MKWNIGYVELTKWKQLFGGRENQIDAQVLSLIAGLLYQGYFISQEFETFFLSNLKNIRPWNPSAFNRGNSDTERKKILSGLLIFFLNQ